MQAIEKEPAEFPIAEAAHPGAGNTSDRAQLIFRLWGCKFLAFLSRFPLLLVSANSESLSFLG